VAVASAGPYASLHLTPDRQSRQHPTTQFFTGRMPFLPPNQQRQGTEGDNNQQKQAAAGCTNDSEKLRNCCQLPNNLGSHLIGSFRVYPILHNGPGDAPELPLPPGDLVPHPMCGSLHTTESTSRTASRLVQPFRHNIQTQTMPHL